MARRSSGLRGDPVEGDRQAALRSAPPLIHIVQSPDLASFYFAPGDLKGLHA